MHILSRLSFSALALSAAFALSFTGCSGDNGADGVAGKDGADGKDAEEVNVDSLAAAIREQVTGTLWDSLYAEPYVDSVYNILFDNTYADKWMDSVREALLDSLKQADYDSLYVKLYDSIYNDIYERNTIRQLTANEWNIKENIYGAFANQYPLMYKDYTNNGKPVPVPVSITVKNSCDKSSSCRWKKIMVKAWIEGATDTASNTEIVNPDSTKIIGVPLKFHNDYLLKITAPKKEQVQVRAYALENDREILFFAESKPTTIHPMQINGAEYTGVKNRDWWDGVWVTPNMDSIPALLDEIAKKLPGGTLKVYQKYADDASIGESTARVVTAIFDVLKSRGIAYTENDGAGSNGQKINYPIEVLRSKQAVCNEFTFLFASIMEAIGFKVALISIPSHMFIGWLPEEDATALNVLETTLLDNKDATFSQAEDAAIETFEKEVTAEAQAAGTATIVFLEDIRKYGITPNDIP